MLKLLFDTIDETIDHSLQTDFIPTFKFYSHSNLKRNMHS